MNAGDRWIWVGDSISAGIFTGSPPVRQSAENLITTNLAKNTGSYIQNLSWSGARVADGDTPMFGWASNFSTVLRISGPPVAKGIVIALGTNDWAQPSVSGAEFIACYRAMVRSAKFHGLAVVGLTPLWRADGATRMQKTDGYWNIVEWGGLIADICTQEGAKFISGYSAPIVSASFCDGVHLDEAGHLYWESYVRAEMQARGHMT